MTTVARLDALARDDPTTAPLARLHAEARRSAGPEWAAGVPAVAQNRLGEGVPLLHGQTLHVDGERVRALLQRLGRIVREFGTPDGERLARACADARLDGGALLAATIMQDDATVVRLATELDIDAAALGTLGGLAAVPLLLACATAAADVVAQSGWREGLCPVCAAWPTLAELRGLERRRWLRCGRCGAGWEAAGDGCTYCANDDFSTLGYLAPEDERESRRVMVCERCRGYLKTFATLGPLAPADVALTDLTSLELDMAAMEREYARPSVVAFPLHVVVATTQRARRWPGRKRDG